MIYNYIAYIFSPPFSTLSLAYLALVLLSTHALIDLWNSTDKDAVQTRLTGAVPVMLSGAILILFGGGFIIRAINIIVLAGMNQEMLSAVGKVAENKLSVSAVPYICAGHFIHHMKIFKSTYGV